MRLNALTSSLYCLPSYEGSGLKSNPKRPSLAGNGLPSYEGSGLKCYDPRNIKEDEKCLPSYEGSGLKFRALPVSRRAVVSPRMRGVD